MSVKKRGCIRAGGYKLRCYGKELLRTQDLERECSVARRVRAHNGDERGVLRACELLAKSGVNER